MSLKDWMSAINRAPSVEDLQRIAEREALWGRSLERNQLPRFIQERLARGKAGELPWMSTGSPAELMLQKSHGIRPLAMVSGNAWYHYGYSWTRGHYEGWHLAIGRMRQEAALLGANAVVDVAMKVTETPAEGGEGDTDNMDFGVTGTAIRIDALPESPDPAIATVSALAFVRLLDAGIVPVGVAIGAEYQWLNETSGTVRASSSVRNIELVKLSRFVQSVRDRAFAQLHEDGRRLGTGVLADTHFSQLLRIEREKMPDRYLARHLALGTAIVHDARHAKSVSPRLVISVADRPLVPRRRRNKLI